MIEAKTIARFGVNAMPVIRGASGRGFGEHLRQTPPEDRTWGDAGKVAGFSSTDKLDGLLADLLGPTALGARLDDLGDKFFVTPQYSALASNGEIPRKHVDLKIARDVAVTGMRALASSKGKDVKARPLGKQKTAVDMLTLALAHSPMAKNEDILRTGVSISTALSLTGLVDYAVNFTEFGGSKQPTDNARNGKARQIFASPVGKVAELIDTKAPNLSADDITLASEIVVMSSLAWAVARPDDVIPVTVGYALGSVGDAFDGALARFKALQNGGTTIEGMLKDVRSDKRQEIATALSLSLVARRRGNHVAANNYAVAAMTAALPALYRSSAESKGYIVPEDGVGTRVMRGVLGGTGLALNRDQDASDILSAVLATGNINTAKERLHVVRHGTKSPYCKGTNFDPKFMEHANIRHNALVPLAASGIALGALALAYRPEVPETSDLAVQ